MSFMLRIEAAQRDPLDQLAVDYFYAQKLEHYPSIDFCRRLVGVPEEDQVVAARLGVAISTVRRWREVGRRASPSRWSCR